jgi:hypothetical protein
VTRGDAKNRSHSSVPPFLRWLFWHMVIGVAVGWTALAAILARDVWHIRTLIGGTSAGVIALIMLAIFFAITFGSAGMGFAVMLRPRDKVDGAD